MEVIHNHLGKSASEHVQRKVSLFMADKKGGYLAFGDDNFTHMQGLFFFDANKWAPYKTVENISLGMTPVKLINNFSTTQRQYETGQEETFTTLNNSMLYSVKNFEGKIRIHLDFRHMFDYSDTGRIYSISDNKGIILVKYEKFANDDLSMKERTVYLAIAGAKQYSKVGTWERREYDYDKRRNSKFEFYVYNALEIGCHKELELCFAFSENEEDALTKAKTILANRQTLLKKMDEYMNHSYKDKDLVKNIAMKAADDLLTHVAITNQHNQSVRDSGIFAGLPWFYQFWSRDELISLGAFILNGRYKFAKQTIMQYLNSIGQDGLLPNRLPASEIKSIDSIGWLFIRADQLISELIKRKSLSMYFNPHELNEIRAGLEKAIHGIIHHHNADGFISGNNQESWMDTSAADRSGKFVEAQCFLLRMMHLHTKLSEKSGQKQIFIHDIDEIEKKVKTAFFKNGMLLDTKDTPAESRYQRPNVFIAYTAYPQLLKREEWKICFDACLKENWLDWGGLATLSHNNPKFCSQYSGEDDKSYHNGDSWYYLNNIAAMCMNSLDKTYYSQKIQRILHASREETLFSGFIGASAEISSAKELRSEGCLSQSWSVATLYQLEHEIND